MLVKASGALELGSCSLTETGWDLGLCYSACAWAHLSSSHKIYKETVVVQSLSPVQLLATSQTAAFQASLSLIISRSLLKFMSIESKKIYKTKSNCVCAQLGQILDKR